jgi:hypothetical protein
MTLYSLTVFWSPGDCRHLWHSHLGPGAADCAISLATRGGDFNGRDPARYTEREYRANARLPAND